LALGRQYVLKSSAARVQTVPSIHAQRQAHGRVVRSSPGGLDQTEPQMLYPNYSQPYGSELFVDVKCGFWSPDFCFLISEPCRLPLEPVLDVLPRFGQVIFAKWFATTFAMSGKSQIHSSRRLVPGSRLAGTDLAFILDSWRIAGDSEVDRQWRL